MHRYLAQHRVGWLLFVFVLLASVFSAAYYLYRGHGRMQHLYEPKLLMLRVDDVAFPKGGQNPIEVMAGSPVTLSCETIRAPAEMGGAGFRFHVGGRTYETSSGKIDVSIPGEIGSTQKVAIDYLLTKDGATRTIDHYEALVRLTAGGEYFAIHALADRDGKPLSKLTVPREVIPYVEAALRLPGEPEAYAVLFFVQAYGTDAPVLQVSSHADSEQQFEAIAAPLKRHRGFGPKLGGYVAWSSEPIQIGAQGRERMVFEVYAGLFEAKKVKSVVERLLSYDGATEDGQVRVKVRPVGRDELKALAWRGWLSEPIRVVRAEPPQSASPIAPNTEN